MKKLMFAAAAIAASVAMADVTSANIVGYNTVDLIAGLNCLATNWQKPGSNKCDLHDVMDTTKLTSYNDDASATGDSLEMYDAGDWTTYYYVNQPSTNPNWGPGYEDVWIDKYFAPTTVEVDPGQAFWLRCKNAVEGFNFAGQVANTFEGTLVLNQGLNLIGNAMPMAFNPLDTTKVMFANQTSYNDDASDTGDSIEIYDAGTWTTYYYVNQPATNPNWGPGYENVWIDKYFAPSDVSRDIPIGKGFWYRAKNAGTTMTFVK